MADFDLPDISATMGAAYDAAESGTEYTSPEREEQADDVTETNPDVEAQQDIDQGDEQTTETPDDDSPALLEPPARWSADDKASFTALPREAQQLVLKRESDVEKHLTKQTQDLSEQGNRYKSLEEVIEPRRQSLIVNYGSEAAGLNTLFALSDMAEKDPAGFINYFAKQRGIDIGSLQEPDDMSDPEITALRNEIKQLRDGQTSAQEMQEQARQQQLTEQVTSFQSAVDDKGESLHPHFDAVRGHMSALLNAGSAKDLPDAYEQAVWANPETRKALMEAQTKTSEAKRIAEAKAKAAAADKAAGTRPRGTNGQFVQTPGKTIDDTMNAVYDSMNA